MEGWAHHRFVIVAVVVTATIFLCQCSLKRSYRCIDRLKAPLNDEAQAFLDTLLTENNRVAGVKGIGTIKWRDKDTYQKCRGAWIGSMPNRFRLEILGISGSPVASLASDGIWDYFLWYADDRLIKRRASQDDLERFLSMSVSIKDLVHFLCGRLPIDMGGMGWLEKEPDGRIQKLIYRERTSRFYYQIYYDTSKKWVQKIERLDEAGDLIIRVTFNKRVFKDGYALPNNITVTNGKDATFDMKMDNVWVNPIITADKFEFKRKN